LTDGEEIIVESRRGKITVETKISDRSPAGTVFMTFAFPETTRTNALTSDAYDFITETPEFKACSVNIKKKLKVNHS